MKKATVVIAIAVMLSSCASIFGHSSSTVSINCKPAGANIEIYNRKGLQIYNGTTPATVQLAHSSGFFKRAEYKLKFSAEGYDPKEWVLHTKIEGWYWCNIFIGG